MSQIQSNTPQPVQRSLLNECQLKPNSRLQQMPVDQRQTVSQTATLLGLRNSKALTGLSMNKSGHYSTFLIRKVKKNGQQKSRRVYNPSAYMRLIQFRILTRILNHIEIPDYIYAFEQGRSIPQMANLHTGKDYVVSLDIKNFFPSIRVDWVKQIFSDIGFGERPAKVLAEICTYSYRLEQGLLCSPKLANAVTAMTFGPALKAYCDSIGATLTIYADDVTISFNSPIFAKDVVERAKSIIEETGIFRINRGKTKRMHKSVRQWVCGCCVNQKVSILRKERYKYRAILHHCRTRGIPATAEFNGLTTSEFISKMMGKLNWFKQLDPVAGGAAVEQFKELVGDPALRVVTTVGSEVTNISLNTSQISSAQTLPVDVNQATLPF